MHAHFFQRIQRDVCRLPKAVIPGSVRRWTVQVEPPPTPEFALTPSTMK
jgi:hypothetical protein